MKLAFSCEYHPDKLEKVVGYKIVNNAIILFSYIVEENDKDFFKFPFVMEFEEAVSFVWGWLNKTEPTGEYPDTDGSVEQGFQITTDGTSWRGGSGFYGSFIAIKPHWIVYGK